MPYSYMCPPVCLQNSNFAIETRICRIPTIVLHLHYTCFYITYVVIILSWPITSKGVTIKFSDWLISQTMASWNPKHRNPANPATEINSIIKQSISRYYCRGSFECVCFDFEVRGLHRFIAHIVYCIHFHFDLKVNANLQIEQYWHYGKSLQIAK